MQAFAKPFRRLIQHENGATAVEYGLIASIMGFALVPIFAGFTADIGSLYGTIANLFP